MRKSRGETTSKVSVSIPKIILEEIDNICSACFFNRSQWFLQAASEKLERERMEKSRALLKRLEDLEEK